MYDDKIMTVTGLFALHTPRVRPHTSERSRELCHHRKRANKWRPLRPI